MSFSQSQRQKALDLLATQGISRLTELLKAGITAATVSRMERNGEVVRIARGLYQLPNAPLTSMHSLAEAIKRQSKAVVCLVSALAFHGLTDQIPSKIWLAIGKGDWSPKEDGVRLRIVRFTDRLLAENVEIHVIDGVDVRVFGITKTIADCFRHRKSVGLSIAIEGLQEALRQGKATPGEIARQAEIGGVSTVMRPYLEALTANA
jgi:predicted transcriptional regulator of viral defense system